MLQISPIALELHLFQKRYNIKLFNNSDHPILFKVLATSWQFFQLDRNLGMMRAHSKLQLLLTVISRTPFRQKLQIMHGQLSNVDLPFETAWRNLKKSRHQIHKDTIAVYLKDEGAEEEQQENQDQQSGEFKRSRSHDIKAKKPMPIRSSINLQPFSGKNLQPIKEDAEIKYLLKKNRHSMNSNSVKKALVHIEKQKQKHLDAEEREELIYEKEQMERKFKLEVNRNQKLIQQLEVAQKKLQNHSLQVLKFQVGHSLGVVCQEYHTSFAGLSVFALAFFMLGYALATL